MKKKIFIFVLGLLSGTIITYLWKEKELETILEFIAEENDYEDLHENV